VALNAGNKERLLHFVGAFSIAHIGLHKLFAHHPANEFNNPFSQILIGGWGATGLLLLALMAV